MTPFRVAGWGRYRPRASRPSTDLDAEFGRPPGWTEEAFGIRCRGVAAADETSSAMGAAAAAEALGRAGWAEGAFDVLIGACGVMEQPIPGTSALIQDRLGLGGSGIPAFDVNQTCLSFLVALDVAAMGLGAGRWSRVLIVSSDVASAGLDPRTPHASAIFGDGAAAVALEAGPPGSGPGLLSARFETYGQAHALATLAAGGTRVRVEEGLDALLAASRFRMEPFAVFKAAARRLPPLIERVMAEAGMALDEVDLVVCHQASHAGLAHVRRLLGARPERVVDLFATTGNQIAASLPFALAHALDEGLAREGDRLLLLGTSAGVSVGAAVLRL
jgi:3-oxoacyl-[acyl-carrier-protein] synthase-3